MDENKAIEQDNVISLAKSDIESIVNSLLGCLKFLNCTELHEEISSKIQSISKTNSKNDLKEIINSTDKELQALWAFYSRLHPTLAKRVKIPQKDPEIEKMSPKSLPVTKSIETELSEIKPKSPKKAKKAPSHPDIMSFFSSSQKSDQVDLPPKLNENQSKRVFAEPFETSFDAYLKFISEQPIQHYSGQNDFKKLTEDVTAMMGDSVIVERKFIYHSENTRPAFYGSIQKPVECPDPLDPLKKVTCLYDDSYVVNYLEDSGEFDEGDGEDLDEDDCEEEDLSYEPESDLIESEEVHEEDMLFNVDGLLSKESMMELGIKAIIWPRAVDSLQKYAQGFSSEEVDEMLYIDNTLPDENSAQ